MIKNFLNKWLPGLASRQIEVEKNYFEKMTGKQYPNPESLSMDELQQMQKKIQLNGERGGLENIVLVVGMGKKHLDGVRIYQKTERWTPENNPYQTKITQIQEKKLEEQRKTELLSLEIKSAKRYFWDKPLEGEPGELPDPELLSIKDLKKWQSVIEKKYENGDTLVRIIALALNLPETDDRIAIYRERFTPTNNPYIHELYNKILLEKCGAIVEQAKKEFKRTVY